MAVCKTVLIECVMANAWFGAKAFQSAVLTALQIFCVARLFCDFEWCDFPKTFIVEMGLHA